MKHSTPPSPSQPVRSEGLLPADEPDPTLEVAEEVAFDQQSGQARQVGAMPPDTAEARPAEAMAEALQNKPEARPAN